MFASCGNKPNSNGEYTMKPVSQSKEVRIKYNKNGGIDYIKEYSGETPEGIFLSFHDNETPDNMVFIKNGKNTGTGLVFFKNGQLNNVGQYADGEKTGWFYVFDKKSVLTGKREYLIIDGKSYMNQWIEYDKNGLPDKMNSSYLNLKAAKDTVTDGEEYDLNVTLEASFFKQYMLLIVGPYDENFKLPANAFCDTIKSKNYNSHYSTKTYKHGINVVRGMVQEIRLQDNNESSYEVRKIYFSKEFYVK